MSFTPQVEYAHTFQRILGRDTWAPYPNAYPKPTQVRVVVSGRPDLVSVPPDISQWQVQYGLAPDRYLT